MLLRSSLAVGVGSQTETLRRAGRVLELIGDVSVAWTVSVRIEDASMDRYVRVPVNASAQAKVVLVRSD